MYKEGMIRFKTLEELNADKATVHDLNVKFPLIYRRYLGCPEDLLPKALKLVLYDKLSPNYKTKCTEVDYAASKEYDTLYNKVDKNLEFKDVASAYSVSYNDAFVVHIVVSPTGNCQLASLASFQTLLFSYDTQMVEIILRCIAQKIRKYLFYFDVKYAVKSYVDKLCFEQINPSKYISTNGSKMYDGKLLINM